MISIDVYCSPLRSPCPPVGTIPPECYLPNGDPCPLGCDTQGNCIEEVPPVGVNIYTTPPCSFIGTQIADSNFIEKVNTLKNNLNLHHEMGFSQDNVGNFTELTPLGLFKLDINITPTTIGFIHMHQNSFESGILDDNGNPKIINPVKIFSPGDVIEFLKLVQNASQNGIPSKMIFGSVYTSSGGYTLRFTGNASTIPLNLLNLSDEELKDLNTDFRDNYINKFYNKEKAFLKFLNDKIGVEAVRLFKINNNNSVKELTLSPSGNSVTRTPCQ